MTYRWKRETKLADKCTGYPRGKRVSDAEFDAYLDWLNREGPRDSRGWVLLHCAYCGQEIGEYAVLRGGHYRETEEPVLTCLHEECARPWEDECHRLLAAREN